LQSSGGRTFLVYAIFSNATPSATAGVFQAYRRRYATLLGGNDLAHVHMAVYRREGLQFFVEYLVNGIPETTNSSTKDAP